MTKNIVIGIGGTGLSAIRELRRLTAERYELGLQDASVKSTRFVYIDTDDGDAGRKSWSVLGKDISMRPSEIAIITGSNTQEFAKHPEDYADFRDWLPQIGDYVGSPGAGAKGIRPFGRLIYEYSQNKTAVREKVLAAYQSLNQEFPHIAAWRYYIICSLSGGTGSGMFIPLAFDLEEWDLFHPDNSAEKLRGFFVMPPLEVVRHDRYHANAFAALKEINFLAVGNGTPNAKKFPFNNVYLLESQNEAGSNIGLDSLPLLIAQRLFLNIQSGPAAAKIDGLMDNPNLGDASTTDPKRKHAFCFSSFGLSTLSYPRETIARCVAWKWAGELIGSWLEERDTPKNVNEVVRNDMPRLRMSKLHINGDADPFGGEDSPPYEKNLAQTVDNRIDPLEKKQLASNANKIREEIEEGFRGKGITAFYQQREKDVTRAAEGALREVKLSVSRQVRDKDRGLRFAKEYLDELTKILETEYRVEVSARFGPTAQNQVGIFQRNYSDTVNTISLHEEQFFYRDSEFARDKANLGEDLKGYLIRAASYSSSKYATKLLDILIPSVKALRASIDVWHSRVAEMFQKAEGMLRAALEGKAQEARENGTVIFNDLILSRVAAQGAPDVVNPAIEERLRERLSEVLQQQMSDLDLFALMDQPDPDALIGRAAFDFVLSKESPLQVGKTTLYDRFLIDYPKPEDRREVFARTRGLSEIFTRWLPAEVQRQKINDVKAGVVSIPDDPANQKAQSQVKAELLSAGVAADEVQQTQDVERIVFVRERQAFPVRFIATVSKLKERYDNYPLREALHIDKRQVSQMYELFLLSEEDKKATEESEEAFLLARVNNWLKLEINPQNRRSEINYEYEIPSKIGKRSVSFGSDWEIAFDRFVQETLAPPAQASANKEGRTLLMEKVRAARQAWKSDLSGWDTQRELLKTYLDESLQGYPARTYDSRYKRDVEIIGRLEDEQGQLKSSQTA